MATSEKSGPAVGMVLGLADEGLQDARPGRAGASPPALTPILGRSPFQRHLRHLSDLGVRRFIVPLPDPTSKGDLEPICRRQASDVLVTPVELAFPVGAGTWEESVPGTGEPVVLVSASAVIDPRLYRAAFAAAAPVWVGDRAAAGGSGVGEPVAVGLRVVAGGGGEAAGATALRGPADELLPVEDLDPYISGLRRTLRPYWASCRDAQGRERAVFAILDATQKGVLDFPARFLHPPVENALVRLISPTPITPNQITVATGFIGFAGAWLFAAGSYAPAILIALLVNVLDGVDGKLARVKLLASRFGDRLDHVLDVLFEFSWYLGIGWGLSGGDPAGTPLRLGFGLIAIMLGSRAVSGIYRLVSGRQIHDHRAFDRAVRLVAGRRNIYVVMLLVGLLAGRFSTAFTVCFVWGAATLLTYCVRTTVEAIHRIVGGARQEQPA